MTSRINSMGRVLALSALLGASAAPTMMTAQARQPIPVPDAPADMTFTALRGVQYCELWMIAGSPETGISGDYYNTSALNDSTDKLDTCPPDLWAKVDADALKAEYSVDTVFKNGPRGWTMDEVTIPVGPVETFDGLGTRWWGRGVLPKGAKFSAGLEPYKPLKSLRKSTFTYKKGAPVFLLEDDEGTRWVMQAFSRITDPSLSYDRLKTLGDSLKPAKSWSYKISTLGEDLTISTPEGYNWIVQDELGNTYDACKEGACNIEP